MPSRSDYDGDEMAAALGPWLAQQLDLAPQHVHVSNLTAPMDTGHSSETLLFDAHIGLGEGGSRDALRHLQFVARAAPPDEVSVFPEYDLGFQFELIRRVASQKAVPLPQPLWLEMSEAVIGRRFFVMEHIAGVVPPDNLPYTIQGWLLDSTPEEQTLLQRSTIESLVEIHTIDPHSSGVMDLFASRGRPMPSDQDPSGVGAQLAWYRSYLDWASAGRMRPRLEAALEHLLSTRPSDDGLTPVLCWGDARIGNIIFENFAPVAILDWEMARLAPREFDIAWMTLFQHYFSTGLGLPDLPGFTPAEELPALYEQRAGVPLADLGWFLTASALEYAIVMMRLLSLMPDKAAAMGLTEDDNMVLDMLDRLVAGGGNL